MRSPNGDSRRVAEPEEIGAGNTSSTARQPNAGGFRDEEEYVENSTRAWARGDSVLSASSRGRSGSGASSYGKRVLEEEDEDESEEENEETGRRYTFFPHRKGNKDDAASTLTGGNDSSAE